MALMMDRYIQTIAPLDMHQPVKMRNSSMTGTMLISPRTTTSTHHSSAQVASSHGGHGSSSSYATASRQVIGRVPDVSPVPAEMTFDTVQQLVQFASSLPSPKSLQSLKRLHIDFHRYEHAVSGSSGSRRESGAGNGTLALGLVLRHAGGLKELVLNWKEVSSSILNATSFILDRFEACYMLVDQPLVAFLEAQQELRTLVLPTWGAHLPPRSMESENHYQQNYYLPPPPPMLTELALPSLCEFGGHLEVASQLAPGRPLQVVNITEGVEYALSDREWEEAIAGFEQSTFGMSTFAVGILPMFSMPMLAQVCSRLPHLDAIYLRVYRLPAVRDIILWDFWAPWLRLLADLEHIDVELVSSDERVSFVEPLMPTHAHVKAWQNHSPLLQSVTMSVDGVRICHWQWKNLRWENMAQARLHQIEY